MSESYLKLLEGNQVWVEEQNQRDPEFFNRLAKGQKPDFLWIGCSDSRVAANQITNMAPGEIFVHRNIANLVIHTDVNLLSVLHYAIEILRVKHVIVCGHYGCGGIAAALSNNSFGLIDNWLRNIKDVYRLHKDELDAITDHTAKERRLVELSVLEQVYNLSKTSVIQEAWKQNALPILHGWAYDVADGKIRNLLSWDKDNSPIEDIYRLSPTNL